MKETVEFLENEIGGLKVQMSAYVPVIASLRDNITSLEHNVLIQPKLCVPSDDEERNVEMADELHEMSSAELQEGQVAFLTAGISDLQEMLIRLKAVEKVVVEEINRLVKQKSSKNSHETEAPPCQETKKGVQVGDDLARNLKSKKKKHETRNGILLKDISLDEVSDSSLCSTADDQMLEPREYAVHECGVDSELNDMQERAIVPGEIVASHQFSDVDKKTDGSSGTLVEELSIDKLEISTSIREPKKEAKSKVLNRLASDADKLMTLQSTVKQLKKRMEMKKRNKAFDLEYGQVKEQLQEVGDAITELLDDNSESIKHVKGSSSPFDGTNTTELEQLGAGDLKKVQQQALKGSEKIGRLQFEVQSIEYVMLKLEDERRSKGKNRTGILLRDFIYSSGRRSGRRKKYCFCGCARPSGSVD